MCGALRVTALSVSGLRVALASRPEDSAFFHAVDQLRITIDAGKCFALVGESGCGKSMTALALLRLLPEGLHIREGEVRLGDVDLLALRESEMLQVRGRRVGIIFQEPSTSLNPVMRIGAQLREVIERHTGVHGAAAVALARAWLGKVGLTDPEACLRAFPFELSGGQKQRAMIAMALAAEPALLIADEPTTALDVRLQAQIMRLLGELQQERGMAMLLITHDLALVSEVADHLALMYAGQIVESQPARHFFAGPIHPYGRLLMEALPGSTGRGARLAAIEGVVPGLRQTFDGCRFAPRCPWAVTACHETAPEFEPLPASRAPATPLELSGATDGDRPAEMVRLASRQDSSGLGAAGVRCHRRTEVLEAQGATPGPQSLSLQTGRVPGAGAEPFKPQAAVLTVQALTVQYRGHDATHAAVRGVSFQLARGETLALVGESGCGKTTIGKALMQLLPEDALVSGKAALMESSGPGRASSGSSEAHRQDAAWQGIERSAPPAVLGLIPRDPQKTRRIQQQLQMIFQDPFASLNPRMRIREVLEEGMLALRSHWSRRERFARVGDLLGKVGLPQDALERYPHEFSGGQRQRIAIARALAVEPQVLICDEPTSALDVSVQAQILNLLSDLRVELGLSLVFITHNLGVVEYLADRVIVMRAGEFVEQGGALELLGNPQHPYTRELLAAVPRL
ncbi:MAG: ABC transporter ATP-binding protein [Betaproteobacteria bacterium]|nr:ABC transporter ATP-binding protein [Betaproteobacteria bacterium]